jgi:hypothetical protein
MMISSAPTETRKWISFYDLRDACALAGCPVCTLQSRAAARYLDNLFYERVNDVPTRLRLHQSLGLCPLHAWQATRVRDSESGLAIIYEDLLHTCQKRLRHTLKAVRRLAPAKGWFDRWRAKINGQPRPPHVLRTTAPCPICDHVQFFEELYLRELLDFFTDGDLLRAFEKSFGLCLPHVDRAIGLFPDHVNLRQLLEAQLKKIEGLRSELQEYLRKLDYRYADEPKGAEVTAWRRAVEMMVGQPPPGGRKR